MARRIMFQIQEAVRSYWEKTTDRKASAADLMEVERLFGAALPASYVEFVTQIGFVVFDDVPGMQMHDLFDYRVGSPKGPEVGEGNIAFLKTPERIIKSHRILTNRQAYEDEEDEDFPKLPKNYLPIGNDAGQGQILMEMGDHSGRIWYWPANDWAWGTEDNTWLGFVAQDFADFINCLRPRSD